MTAREMELEAKVFWQLARTHAALRIAFGAFDPRTAEAREDIEAVAMYSDWPALRDRAKALVAHPEPVALAARPA
jgi:hypothetical protein